MRERTDPRLLRSREAMVAAATELLTESGLEAVTHQAVAARAGVGRATVYRHWPGLLDLRLAALESGMPPLPPMPEELRTATGGDPRTELVHRLSVLAERWDDEQAGAVLAAILGGSRHDEGMRRLRESLLEQIADALRPAVAAAVARGQLRSDVTPETFAMATAGPLFFERFLAGNRLGRDTVETVVDAALRAWA
ncbi:TetR family transcriptional regulator [Streptomyces sp. Ag109_O5-1]|uniref:TetR/AcrR family transcriptional regulator n=1 Tax=Streptomyces sp. Ag109_O5-1 TaxID=1938851 RepID=UPI000F50C2BF|nr:TetR/AcrR family transcriptional regulator [Streptomyces sp. Ag109_O5-1]RPE37588.1 TetR family transcriptional regulator [Streptomyces sp. Ag109_O5-1]